jgi:rod shape-determining protein MreC
MKVQQRTDEPVPRLGLLGLFVALSIVLMTVWFRESSEGPLHRVRAGVQAATAPVAAGGEYVSRPMRGVIAWVGDLGVSRSQLEQLRAQNVELRARVAGLEEARLENRRLRELLRLPQARDTESMAARVIGRPTNSWEGVITIDRGSADGVAIGMPVIGPQGLLGQTIQVAGNSAKVRLISDQRSGVAALIQRSRVEGVLKGGIDGSVSLDFVSRETTVKAGDVVITSGEGGVFPKGVVIGEVAKVDRQGDSLFQVIAVTPASDLRRLEEVIILTGSASTVAPQGGE